MGENHCGRSCEGCCYKESLDCPGCESWASEEMNTTCEVISCCKIRMQTSCTSCSSKNVCDKYKEHQETPENIKRKLKEDDEKVNKVKKYYDLSESFRKMFVLFIATMVIDLLFGLVLGSFSQVFDIIGNVALAICNIMCAVIILKLSKYDGAYKKAGIFGIIGSLRSIAIIMPATNGFIITISLIIMIAGFVLSLVSLFIEYRAHAKLTENFDRKISENWRYLFLAKILEYVMLIFSGIGDSSLYHVAVLLLHTVVKFILLKKTYELFDELSGRYKRDSW